MVVCGLGNRLPSAQAAGATALSVKNTVNSDSFRASLVEGIYQKLLARGATATETTPLVADLKSGGKTWQQVVVTVAGSPSYFQKAGNDNAAFVNNVFQDLVGRAPDAAEETGASIDYLKGGGTREQLAEVIVDTDEFRAYWTQNFYQQFLGRDATEAETTDGTTKLDSGDPTALITSILSSSEYFQKAGGTQSGWQKSVNEALGVSGTAGGPVDTGTTSTTPPEYTPPAPANNSRTPMVQALLLSPEYFSRIIGNYYQKYLRRAPTPAEQQQWTGVLQGGAPSDQVMTGILTSDEYYNRAGGTTTGFLNQLSQDLLGKAGAAGGKKGMPTKDDLLDILRNLPKKKQETD